MIVYQLVEGGGGGLPFLLLGEFGLLQDIKLSNQKIYVYKIICNHEKVKFCMCPLQNRT